MSYQEIFDFFQKITSEINNQILIVTRSVQKMNQTIDKLSKSLTNSILEISENFQALMNLIQSSRNAQFNVVFSMFTKNTEAIEEIRDIALNFGEEQLKTRKALDDTIHMLQKQVSDNQFQNVILDIRSLIESLNNVQM
ncbi:MAG: hypothetical protein EAX96_19055 [Candidatus Lokiarchaeota archaeon]|nr:hypothetical protein [Candidatus Lokiarchaeota archaeon]